MVKVGAVITTSTGSYCSVELDSGEKLLVTHHEGRGTGSPGERLTVERIKFLDFSSEPAVDLSLNGIDGQAVLAALAGEGIEQGALLRRFVEYLAGCRSLAEVVARSRQLGG